MNGREIWNVEENAAEYEVIGERVHWSVELQSVFGHYGTRTDGENKMGSLTAR